LSVAQPCSEKMLKQNKNKIPNVHRFPIIFPSFLIYKKKEFDNKKG
jgi:hypothetical protein